VQGNFSAAWEELGEENELSDAFSLPMKSLEEAVKNITLYLGLQVSFPPVFRSRVRFCKSSNWDDANLQVTWSGVINLQRTMLQDYDFSFTMTLGPMPAKLEVSR
jgi:hypothetical protein